MSNLEEIEEPGYPSVPSDIWDTIKDCSTDAEVVDELLRIEAAVPMWAAFDPIRSACLAKLRIVALNMRGRKQ